MGAWREGIALEFLLRGLMEQLAWAGIRMREQFVWVRNKGEIRGISWALKALSSCEQERDL